MVVFTGGSKERDETSGEFGLDSVCDEVFERLGVEFMAGDLALHSPELAVDNKDSISKKLVEAVTEARAFDVVGEIGDEEVADVEGIGGADAMGDVKEGVDLDSEGRGFGNHFGNPVVEAMAVAE